MTEDEVVAVAAQQTRADRGEERLDKARDRTIEDRTEVLEGEPGSQGRPGCKDSA
ncbi:hypothetical protein ACFPM0_28565 [Pseudonocardia sulfidoxydans]|uniref:hypothetical protein n=1 Tax=Pseudonocardia sulfidoxydans TaxID=54011 RepID=UPI003614048D